MLHRSGPLLLFLMLGRRLPVWSRRRLRMLHGRGPLFLHRRLRLW